MGGLRDRRALHGPGGRLARLCALGARRLPEGLVHVQRRALLRGARARASSCVSRSLRGCVATRVPRQDGSLSVSLAVPRCEPYPLSGTRHRRTNALGSFDETPLVSDVVCMGGLLNFTAHNVFKVARNIAKESDIASTYMDACASNHTREPSIAVSSTVDRNLVASRQTARAPRTSARSRACASSVRARVASRGRLSGTTPLARSPSPPCGRRGAITNTRRALVARRSSFVAVVVARAKRAVGGRVQSVHGGHEQRRGRRAAHAKLALVRGALATDARERRRERPPGLRRRRRRHGVVHQRHARGLERVGRPHVEARRVRRVAWLARGVSTTARPRPTSGRRRGAAADDPAPRGVRARSGAIGEAERWWPPLIHGAHRVARGSAAATRGRAQRKPSMVIRGGSLVVDGRCGPRI